MALEGTLKTPFGAVQKKTAAIVGGFVAVVFAAVWYRNRQNAATSAATSGEIDPATGFTYGSAEDAAALASQAAFVSPGSGGGGGSSGSSDGGVSGPPFTSNSAWSQYVIQYMTDHSLVVDPGPLSAALGKYLLGKPVTDPEISLIQQAIAVGGKPPLSGDTGYPPSINTSPVVGPTTPPAVLRFPNHFAAVLPVGVHETDFTWEPVPDAKSYQIQSTSPPSTIYTFGGPVAKIYPLAAGTAYHWKIRTVNSAGVPGPWYGPIQVTTKK